MKTNRILVAALAGVAGTVWSLTACADARASFEANCAACHEAADFEGEDVAGLADTLRKMSSGQMKHKGKLLLSDAEAREMAGFLARGGR